MTVYIPTSISKETPPAGKNVTWLSVDGDGFFGALSDFHPWINGADHSVASYHEYDSWLKDVKLPTEGEIEATADEYSEHFLDDPHNISTYAFKDGANYILDKLK